MENKNKLKLIETVNPAQIFDEEFLHLKTLGFFSDKDYEIAKHYYCFKYFSEGILLYHKPQVYVLNNRRFLENVKGVFLFLSNLFRINN